MIKVTMTDVINFRDNAGFFADAHLPLKGAYKINKIRKAVDKESDFYIEKFQEIINKYAQKDEDGNVVFSDDKERIMIEEDKIEECNEALIELQKLEVEIETYDLTLDDLGDIECTPDQLEVLMPFMD